MAKRTIKITIKLPTGVVATDELTEKATQAANDAISSIVGDLLEARKISEQLAAQGIEMTPEEVLNRKINGGGSATSPRGTRRRVVLDEDMRQALIADLSEGAKIAESAKIWRVDCNGHEHQDRRRTDKEKKLEH